MLCGIYQMEPYCVSCEKNTVKEISNARRTSQDKLMLASNCAVCDSLKMRNEMRNEERKRV